jgi:hypothetical protein
MGQSLRKRQDMFNQLLLEAVDEGLSCLGEFPKLSIYFHLEKKFGLRKAEIPSRIEDCDRALDDLFGNAASMLKVHIMKQLHIKIGTLIEWPDAERFGFTKYVSLVKLKYTSNGNEKTSTECIDIQPGLILSPKEKTI